MSSDPELESMLPPNSPDAERALLGCVLRDPPSLFEASRDVEASDFYSDAHQRIWRVFLYLSSESKAIDAVLVWEEIKKRKETGDIGGPGYLIELWNSAPSTTIATHYAKIVRGHSRLRSIIRTGQRLQQAAFAKGADADDIIAEASKAVFKLACEAKTETVTWESAVTESLEVIDRRAGKLKDGGSENGLLTGWENLDRLTGGLHKRELIILAARPSVGKTLAALNVIDAVASEGGKVFFASLEQGRTELLHRILSKRSGLNSHKFRTGKFSEHEGDQLMAAVKAIRNHRVWINDGAGQPLSQVSAESRRLKTRHGLDMIVVDYLGLMDGDRDRRSSNRNEEIGRLTRGLKGLAKDLDVVVFCLAQLNRGPENRPDKRPRLWDLRDSGEIEQDADTVFMLHKPEEKDATREVDRLDWLIEKQRNGPCGEIAMQHHKRTFSITELVMP